VLTKITTHPEVAIIAVVQLEHIAVDVAVGVGGPGNGDGVVLGVALLGQNPRGTGRCKRKISVRGASPITHVSGVIEQKQDR
jgi:hypothetical protein